LTLTVVVELHEFVELGTDPLSHGAGNEQIACDVLKAIFERFAKRKFSENGPVAWDTAAHATLEAAAAGEEQAFLSPELALYLRVRCQWAKAQKQNSDTILDRLILDLSTMSELTSYHYQQARGSTDLDNTHNHHGIADSDCYIARQMLNCLEMADFSDEAGRVKVVQLIRGMLSEFGTHARSEDTRCFLLRS